MVEITKVLVMRESSINKYKSQYQNDRFYTDAYKFFSFGAQTIYLKCNVNKPAVKGQVVKH